MILKLMITSYINSYLRLFAGDGYLIMKVKTRLEYKINVTLPALLPNMIVQNSRGLATSSEKLGMKNMALERRELYHY